MVLVGTLFYALVLVIVNQDYELCSFLIIYLSDHGLAIIPKICIGNGKDFSGKVLVGGLPSPPRYSCILSNGKDFGGGDVSGKDF